jgi:hypothetical protein
MGPSGMNGMKPDLSSKREKNGNNFNPSQEEPKSNICPSPRHERVFRCWIIECFAQAEDKITHPENRNAVMQGGRSFGRLRAFNLRTSTKCQRSFTSGVSSVLSSASSHPLCSHFQSVIVPSDAPVPRTPMFENSLSWKASEVTGGTRGE